VSTRILIDLWRIEFGVDVRPNFAGLNHLGLWESPTGLYFFDPLCEGDNAFYIGFYENLKKRRFFTDKTMRQEFRMAAERIPPGARVLDVGCGHGNFQRCVPHANYTGLDPNFAEQSPVADVRNESLEQHLVAHSGGYDAVCCFEVLEHLRDPRAMFAGIVQAAKPGGLICIGVPHVPSVFTRIPNLLTSAPPHHLTWWTKAALCDLATSAGALVESVENVPWAGEEALLYWMERCSFIKCSEVHFRGGVAWHLSALTGYMLGLIAFNLLGAPRKTTDEGAGLLMIARRPAAA